MDARKRKRQQEATLERRKRLAAKRWRYKEALFDSDFEDKFGMMPADAPAVLPGEFDSFFVFRDVEEPARLSAAFKAFQEDEAFRRDFLDAARKFVGQRTAEAVIHNF